MAGKSPFAPPEFEATYGWKNDPEKIRLSAAAADKPNDSKEDKRK